MVKLTETQKVRELIKLSTEDSEDIRKLRKENEKLCEDLEHERECSRQTRKLITEYEFVIDKLRSELDTFKNCDETHRQYFMGYYAGSVDLMNVRRELDILRKHRAYASEALKFYADKKHIVETEFCSVGNLEERCKDGFTIESEFFLHEDGKRARDALERIK
jgi:hypothetical protein